MYAHTFAQIVILKSCWFNKHRLNNLIFDLSYFLLLFATYLLLYVKLSTRKKCNSRSKLSNSPRENLYFCKAIHANLQLSRVSLVMLHSWIADQNLTFYGTAEFDVIPNITLIMCTIIILKVIYLQKLLTYEYMKYAGIRLCCCYCSKFNQSAP